MAVLKVFAVLLYFLLHFMGVLYGEMFQGHATSWGFPLTPSLGCKELVMNDAILLSEMSGIHGDAVNGHGGHQRGCHSHREMLICCRA